MRVVFVTLGQPLLGVEYLSAALQQAGHSTVLVHNPALFDDRFVLHFPRLARLFSRDDVIVREILDCSPDLLACSAVTPAFGWAAEIAQRVKRERPGIKTVFGGVHASACPEHVMGLEAADFVCVGEGEEALVRLADALQRGETGADIPNMWSKGADGPQPPPSIAGFNSALDSLPLPDKELYAATFPTGDVYHIITGRGCPYRCTFCFNNSFANLPTAGRPRDYVRRRSPDNVLRELRAAKERFAPQVIWFWDDVFTMDGEWLREFLPRYKKEIGLPWIAQTHPQFISPELARRMKDAGCLKVQVGVQSLGDADYKRRVLRRNESRDSIVAMIAAFHDAGIELVLDHIFGLPGEGLDSHEFARRFYMRHTPDRIATFFLSYMPGVEITRRAHEAGVLSDADIERIHRGEVLSFHEAASPAREVRAELRLLRGYMSAFHLLPVFPRFLRGLLRPGLLGRIPGMVLFSKIVSFAALFLRGFRGGDRAGRLYVSYYLYHLLGRVSRF
ncbi:MAG: radical SAM protein [Elusimicrobiota bacterium]